MPNYSDDALQKRLARLLEAVPAPSSFTAAGDFCLGTSIGAVRKENQDRGLLAFAKYADTPSRNFVLAAVCDGIGGLSGGDQAAVITITTFVSRVLRMPKLPISERLRLAAASANDAVHHQFHGRGGATLSAAIIGLDDDIVGVNVGDSRIYGITSSRKLSQLSRDDTLAGYLGKSGGDHRNQIVQYVGMGEGLEPHIILIKRGDYSDILITSDGVHNSPPEALNQVVGSAKNNLDLVRNLITLSDVLGGRDNATSIAVSSHFEETNPDRGLSLTFLSSAGEIEIWFPILQELSRTNHVPPDLREVSDIGSARQTAARPESPERKRPGVKGGGRRSRKKKAQVIDPGLPLDEEEVPPLKIEFPKKQAD